MEFCGMKREIAKITRVFTRAQSFDRCEARRWVGQPLTEEPENSGLEIGPEVSQRSNDWACASIFVGTRA